MKNGQLFSPDSIDKISEIVDMEDVIWFHQSDAHFRKNFNYVPLVKNGKLSLPDPTDKTSKKYNSYGYYWAIAIKNEEGEFEEAIEENDNDRDNELGEIP